MKIFISFIVTICATVLLYLCFWTIHAINLSRNNIANSFIANNINFYQNQKYNSGNNPPDYDYIDGSHFDPNKQSQQLYDYTLNSPVLLRKLNLSDLTKNAISSLKYR